MHMRESLSYSWSLEIAMLSFGTSIIISIIDTTRNTNTFFQWCVNHVCVLMAVQALIKSLGGHAAVHTGNYCLAIWSMTKPPQQAFTYQN